MSIIQWTYQLLIRSKDSGGTVLHTFQALNDPTTGTINQPKRCGPPTYEPKLVGTREALDWQETNVYAGFRKHIKIAFESAAAYIRGKSGAGTIVPDLDTVLSDIVTLGNYLELSLDNGTTWRTVNLLSSIGYVAVDGKNVRLGLELEFSTISIFSTVGGVAAADW